MREEDVQSKEGGMEKKENMLRKEMQDVMDTCIQKLEKQEAERENIENSLRKEVKDIRREYTKKLGKQETLIKDCLNRQGYYF